MWFKSYELFHYLVTDGRTDGWTHIVIFVLRNAKLETTVILEFMFDKRRAVDSLNYIPLEHDLL